MGGYIEIMVPNAPEFEGQAWSVRVIARIEAGDETAYNTGKALIQQKGFHETPNDPKRFQKFIYVDIEIDKSITHHLIP